MIFKKIRKGHINWQDFLCSIPARDYVFQKDAYEDQIDRTAEYIRNADCVIIGAGAGASTAAGIQYGGKRFTDNFAEFIKKYGGHYMTDMYTAGFYPYPSEEAKWGYWSKHALMNRYDPPALPLYNELYDIVKDKEYFVLTTNVDHQFYKAGFDEQRIFATQGDYGKIQCQKACHPKTYDAEELFRKMDEARKDCLIPSELVPKCPVCGGNMAMNLRCDNYFVDDEAWHEAADRYADFLEQNKDKKVVLLELGVGFNTPIIIRFPFEKMVREHSSYSLIRLNMDEAVGPIIQWKVRKEDEALLASCYTECLKLAADTGAESIAFCCLSTGVFRFPQQRAAEIATNTVKQYLNEDSRIKKVIFNVFKDEDLKIYSGLL